MTSKFEGIVESLKNKNSTGTSEIYTRLISKIKKNRKGVIKLLSDIIACVRRDLVTKDKESADAAFRFLSHFYDVAASQLSDGNEDVMKPMFLEALVSTASADCIHEYFPVVFSDIPKDEFVSLSYQTICQEKKNLSFVIKEEMLKLLSKISVDRENATPNFSECYPQTLQIVLVFTTDNEDLLRKHAVSAAADFIQVHPIQPTEISQIMNCMKNLISPKLNSLLKKNAECLQEFLDDQLPLYLKIVGINMRKSSSLTNTFLKIIEQGFRDSSVDAKAASFKTWKVLIDELSVDLEILSSSRYMNLVMQPLTTMQSSESLNVLRIKTLWGLAKKLKNKLPALFPTVCLPILHCCLGNLDGSKRMSDVRGSTSKINRKSSFYTAMQATGYRATPNKASRSSKLHKIGVQVLMHLMSYAEEEDLFETSKLAITKLDTKFLSTATFNSYGQIFIAAVEEVLCNKSRISSELAIELWNRLHHHSKTLLELNLQKKKREPEMFNALMLAFANILATSSLSSGVTFSMLKTFLEFPDSILSSTFYGGASNGVHGFPALTLLQLLFSGRLALEQSSHGPLELLTCACDLVTLGFNSIIGILPYCSSVLEILVSFAQKTLIGTIEERCTVDQCVDIMFKLWVKIGAGLKDHIEKTQEVNQGDNLDHDFTTLYFFLLFPVHVKTFKEDCIDTWDCVYDEFCNGSNFVRTCKPNEISSYLSSKILKLMDTNWSNSALEFVGHICNTMANKAQYNHGGFSKPKLSRHDSTSMSPKRLPACELVLEIHENLAELCLLVKKLFAILSEKPNPRLCDANMKCLAHLFSSIYYSEDIKILFRTFVPSLRNVVASNHENVKIFCERLQTIFHSVENVYRSCVMEKNMVVFQEDFHLLICECIQNSSSKIRNTAVELWQNVAVDSQQHALICKSMTTETKSHLFPVYKIMGWSCPWKDVELPATLELPEYSEDTQSSDMVTVGYGAFGSPIKSNRFASPRKTQQRAVSSPMKAVATPPTFKRKLDTTSGNINYVNCVSPFTKPRTPLTERQKEKLREREFIPTMYNELDEKQEVDIEIDTQEDFAVNKRPDKCGDIIESSQSQESPKKKLKMDMGDKDVSRSIATSTNSGDELNDTRTGNDSTTEMQQCNDESRVSDSGYTDNEGLTTGMSSSFETVDNIGDDEENATTFTSNSNHSYEYVEMNGASTNETHDDRNITFDNDDKDLGVTPLDESYEYVVMADMSIDARNFTNASMHASPHSGEVAADKETALSEQVSKSMTRISVQLDRIKEEHDTNDSICKKKSKRGRPKRKDKIQADLAVDDDSATFHDNSNAGSHDSYSPASSQSNVKGQRNQTKPTKKKKAGNASKAQPEREEDVVIENDAEQPTLRRSQRSKKKTSKCQQSEDKNEVTLAIDKHAEATSYEGLKMEAVCMSDVGYELPTSNTDIDTASPVQSGDLTAGSNNIEEYSDMNVTDADVGSDEDNKDNDMTLYEYVEVADTSCFNVSRQSNSTVHNDSTISKISSNDNWESENEVKTDVSDVTSKSEGVCETMPVASEFTSTDVTVSLGAICNANSTFVVESEVPSNVVTASNTNSTFVIEPEVSSDVMMASNHSSRDTNSTFPVESVVADNDVPFSNNSINSTFTVETNSDEDDFRDARSSLGLCQSINTAASSTVNHSNACIEDDPNFKEKDISAISIEVSKDKKTVDNLSEKRSSGGQVSDKNMGDMSVTYETANLNLEKDPTVSKITPIKAANIESLTDEYQTSPVSSKWRSSVPMEIGDLNSTSTDSPSAKGILKRRNVVADSSPAVSPSNKRVSFAEPVSITGITCTTSNGEHTDVLQSPRSVRYRGKNVPKVNRRLSLQADRMRYPHENKVAVSPLSLRSVRVAEAIANIRAKDSNSSRLLFNRTNNDDVIDFGKISISDLQNHEFLRSLDREQGLQLFRILNSIELDLVTNVLGT